MRNKDVQKFWAIALLSILGCAEEPIQLAANGDPGELGGGCEPILEPPVPIEDYLPGSASGRQFIMPANHLGEDIELVEGTAVRAIGNGRIVAYRSATGYGELVVVIEHDLGEAREFPNGLGEMVTTRYLLSIYGHLRNSERRGGAALPWRDGSEVQRGEIIGYVNDDAHNGDGAEHLHLGLRLASAAEAQSADPTAWFRGYDTSSFDYRGQFAAAAVVIRMAELEAASCALSCESYSETTTPIEEPTPVDPPRVVPPLDHGPDPVMGSLTVTWRPPGNREVYRMLLSGRVIAADGTSSPWRDYEQIYHASRVSATLTLYSCETFAFSVEYEQGDLLSWSCLGNGIPNGTAAATWNGVAITPTIILAGGGCGLMVQAPCEDTPVSGTPTSTTPPADPPAADPPSATPPPADSTPPANTGGSSGNSNTITCALLAGSLTITVRGALNSQTLHEGGLPAIGFISLGSDQTGWNASTTPPRYFAVWNGPAYSHTLTVPSSVNRFSLWAAGPAGVRWFNLYQWSTSGAGCHTAPDGLGGIVILR